MRTDNMALPPVIGWAVALMALAMPTQSPAQRPSLLMPDRPTEGLLTASDTRSSSGGFQDAYFFVGQANQPVEITVSSQDFDTFLVLRSPTGAEEMNDDARDGSTDSQIATVLSETGTHTVTVTSFAPDQTGTYEITLRRGRVGQSSVDAPSTSSATAPTPSQATPIAYGETVQGSLSATDAIRSGCWEDHFEFTGSTGDAVTIALDSVEVDPLVRLISPVGGETSDDDHGEGTNALLQVTLSETGTHTIVATTFNPGEQGSYTLRLEGGPAAALPPVPPGASALAVGQSVTGHLDPTDTRRSGGQWAEHHLLPVVPGDVIEITMSSPDVDSYVILRAPSGHEVFDDDGGAMFDSRLVATITESGLHEIIATSYGPEEQGRYTLAVNRTTAAAAAVTSPPIPPFGGMMFTRTVSGPTGQGTPIQIGQAISGTLRAGDEELPSGTLFDRYSFLGEAGQAVEVIMESQLVDTYLIVRRPNGEQQENDDYQMSTSISRVHMTFAETGYHDIIATTFFAGESGSYSLTVSAAEPLRNTHGGPIRVGQSVEGVLAAGDPTMTDGEYCDEYELEVQSGQQIQIRLTSGDFDTYLVYLDPSGIQQDNDDMDFDLNSGLDVTVGASGTARIGVTSYRPGAIGSYTLRVDGESLGGALGVRSAIPNAGPSTALTRGRTVNGQLGPGDQILSTGELCDVFSMFGQAGQTFTVSLSSGDLEPRILIRLPGGEQIESSPPTGGETTLNATVPQTGPCTIVATTTTTGQMGRYSLRVQ
ncbi:hypothetical protein JXA47_07370 [Candidatus Sumerlaeota bacterium]|nr:hypothetical protein [Candidatus Sumerlaeota bacterium]